MSSLIQTLSDILRPELVQTGLLRLEEGDSGSICKAITLHKSGQAIVLRPDQSAGKLCTRPDCGLSISANDRLFPLFRPNLPGLSSMCDYLVFCQRASGDEARLFVLLCELKSGKAEGSRKQLENGRLLADYILAMAKQHGALQSMPEIVRRGLVFSTNYNIPKGSLRKAPCKYSPMPGGFPDMPFAYYACGQEYPLEHFCV